MYGVTVYLFWTVYQTLDQTSLESLHIPRNISRDENSMNSLFPCIRGVYIVYWSASQEAVFLPLALLSQSLLCTQGYCSLVPSRLPLAQCHSVSKERLLFPEFSFFPSVYMAGYNDHHEPLISPLGVRNRPQKYGEWLIMQVKRQRTADLEYVS